MTLIIILIALILDRTVGRKSHLHSTWYTSWYAQWLTDKKLFSVKTDKTTLTLAIFLPMLVTHLLTDALPGLLQFLFECLILFTVLRHTEKASLYQAFREAAKRQDVEACCLTAEKLLPDESINNQATLNRAVGRELAWVNFQFYASVIIWFTVFGAAGVVLFALVRDWVLLSRHNKHLPSDILHTCLEWLNFVPARITTSGYLFVGDFSRALPVWLKYLTNVSVSARQVITHVATKATTAHEVGNELHAVPVSYVELVKRTTKTLVVVVAFLTIIGALN